MNIKFHVFSSHTTRPFRNQQPLSVRSPATHRQGAFSSCGFTDQPWKMCDDFTTLPFMWATWAVWQSIECTPHLRNVDLWYRQKIQSKTNKQTYNMIKFVNVYSDTELYMRVLCYSSIAILAEAGLPIVVRQERCLWWIRRSNLNHQFNKKTAWCL